MGDTVRSAARGVGQLLCLSERDNMKSLGPASCGFWCRSADGVNEAGGAMPVSLSWPSPFPHTRPRPAEGHLSLGLPGSTEDPRQKSQHHGHRPRLGARAVEPQGTLGEGRRTPWGSPRKLPVGRGEALPEVEALQQRTGPLHSGLKKALKSPEHQGHLPACPEDICLPVPSQTQALAPPWRRGIQTL